MDYAALVRKPRGPQDLHDDVDRGSGIEGSLLAHDRLQRTAGDVLHRDVAGAVPLAAIEYSDNIGMRQPRGAGRLPPEALDELLVFGEVMVQHLHGDLPAKELVFGEVDIGHTP